MIDLWNYEKLYQLHPSILSNQTLEELYLTRCTKLECVKGNLKSLKTFYGYNCSSLKEFSTSSENCRIWISLCGELKVYQMK
ncbi:hypothetical protein HN51_048819 [Arachis hypogaea]